VFHWSRSIVRAQLVVQGRSLGELKDFATSGFAQSLGSPVIPLVRTVEVEASGQDDFPVDDSLTVRDLDDSSFEHDTQAATGATTGAWLVEFYAP
jgi:hypothetical protein